MNMFHPTHVRQDQIEEGAILIVDVDYRGDYAVAAGVLISDWDSTECCTITCRIDEVEDYVAGSFYKRELPCILEVLKHVRVPVGCIIIDGYVFLGEDQHDGLGALLHKATGIPVIGVAKTYFKGTPDECQVLRGNSKSPLYVNCIGGDPDDARFCIKEMAGDFRIPGMIKYADHCCRSFPHYEK